VCAHFGYTRSGQSNAALTVILARFSPPLVNLHGRL
jgi:hypothetical protein